jgi:hypothetical protein
LVDEEEATNKSFRNQAEQHKSKKSFFLNTKKNEQKKLDSDHGIIIISPCGNKIKIMRKDGTMVKSNLTAKWHLEV